MAESHTLTKVRSLAPMFVLVSDMCASLLFGSGRGEQRGKHAFLRVVAEQFACVLPANSFHRPGRAYNYMTSTEYIVSISIPWYYL